MGIYKKKNPLGNTDSYKARLVAKLFTQKEIIDYTKTFSPIFKKDSLLVAHCDLKLQQME